MRIIVNGTPREVVATTLAGALEEVGIVGRFATAVNGVFVPAAGREIALSEGDAVEALAPMQGG
ncbi:sulfur carrier protein ThiS [Falsirhodobacter xinxiangensis]|uniref:sulfur carrier protein ThiS n=1 Tax=Falsirhodobacter xinxiangensis TaxID=2530049 RepID=UPI0010AA9432|nr:sulfur carrier protein ThiS [Rhodobacter xinxiangensis]